MMKAPNHFKNTIKTYLDKRAERDVLFSFRYSLPEKQLYDCNYIDNFRLEDKDLHYAKYVCPADLHKEHNRSVAKKAKIKLEQEIQQHLDKEDSLILSACIDGKQIPINYFLTSENWESSNLFWKPKSLHTIADCREYSIL